MLSRNKQTIKPTLAIVGFERATRKGQCILEDVLMILRIRDNKLNVPITSNKNNNL